VAVAPERIDTFVWEWKLSGAWPIHFDGDEVLIVRRAHDLFLEYLKADMVVVGRNVIGTPARPVVDMLEHYRLTEWLKTFVAEKLRRICGLESGRGWKQFEWKHPADEFLPKFRLSDFRGESLRLLVSWDLARANAEWERIEADKQAAANQAVACARSHAHHWAVPVLENKTKQDLTTLTEKFGVTVKKSASKAEMVKVCAEHQGLCEHVLEIPETRNTEV
jgi:hypothetical protein